MRPETILQALSETRPALLDEAAEPRMSRRRLRPLYRAVLIAAVLLLLAGSVYAGAKALAPKVPAAELHNPGGFDVHFSRKVARRAMGDGWVFTFIQNESKHGDDAELIPYEFFGVNLRHRYDDDYLRVVTHIGEDPTPYAERYEDYLQGSAYGNGEGSVLRELWVPDKLYWGEGSAAQQRDMEQIEAILGSGMTPEALLALDPADYSFASFDKMIFFDLLREALTGAPHEEGTDPNYYNIQPVALLTEPTWQNGCKLQIGWLSEMGCIDELFIDLLYKTGEGRRDYVQLSDLVEAGEASAEQREAFELLQTVAERVKTSNRFLAGAELYRGRTLAGMDFDRLWTFMNDLHENKPEAYYEQPEPETIR